MKFGLSQKNIDSINAIFAQYSAVKKAIIYGSRAKGNYKTGSDIDLTLIEDDLNFTELLEMENKLDDLLLPYKIDLSQKRIISNPELIRSILIEWGKYFIHPRQVQTN